MTDSYVVARMSYENQNQHLAAVVVHLADKLGGVPVSEDVQDMIEIARAIVADAYPDGRRVAQDSPRWCETCQAYGDHHTDRHALYFDGEAT